MGDTGFEPVSSIVGATGVDLPKLLFNRYLQDHVGNNDKVVRHNLKRPLGRPQTSSYVEAQPEPPPRPV